MDIDIRHNIAALSRDFADVHRRHIPFATMLAMTETAKDAKVEEIRVMRRVFDRPSPYTLNALQAKPASKQTLIASVEFKEYAGKGTPAKRFLNPQAHGGPRSQKSHERQIAPLLRGSSYLVPARGVPLDAYGNMPASTIKRIVTQLKVSTDPHSNASGSRRSKKARKASAFFVNSSRTMVMERKGSTVAPVLIGVRAPSYNRAFPFEQTVADVVARRMAPNFDQAMARAISTANFKGKWS